MTSGRRKPNNNHFHPNLNFDRRGSSPLRCTRSTSYSSRSPQLVLTVQSRAISTELVHSRGMSSALCPMPGRLSKKATASRTSYHTTPRIGFGMAGINLHSTMRFEVHKHCSCAVKGATVMSKVGGGDLNWIITTFCFYH